MITYHRDCFKDDVLEDVKSHVIASLSAMASETDDPEEFADEVQLGITEFENGTRVVGKLDKSPTRYEVSSHREPSHNRPQQGFGERLMTPEQLQKHLIAKGLGS